MVEWKSEREGHYKMVPIEWIPKVQKPLIVDSKGFRLFYDFQIYILH